MFNDDFLSLVFNPRITMIDYESNYRPQGKVMFSQVSVCPQSVSWFTAPPCYGAVGIHPTGMLSSWCCFQIILRIMFCLFMSVEISSWYLLSICVFGRETE